MRIALICVLATATVLSQQRPPDVIRFEGSLFPKSAKSFYEVISYSLAKGIDQLGNDRFYPKPWQPISLRLPERDAIGRNNDYFRDALFETNVAWAPSQDVVNGPARLKTFRDAALTGKSRDCKDLGLSVGIDEPDCRVYVAIGSDGSRGLLVCRLADDDPLRITPSCLLVAIAVDGYYWIQAILTQSGAQQFACCGEIFFHEFPCAIPSTQRAVDAISRTLEASPLLLSPTTSDDTVRAVVQWRPSPFLKGPWREHFSLVVRVGANPPRSFSDERKPPGYSAQIDYILKNGASGEPEQMHLPNARQKKTVYDSIFAALAAGVEKRLCSAQ